jgi:fumarate reductase flavoprotein subunit
MKKKDDIKKGMGRRDFLKKGAFTIGTGAAATSGVLGIGTKIAQASNKRSKYSSSNNDRCDVNMKNVNPVKPVSPPSKYDHETDVLVIGWGVGGTMAALSATKRGAKVIALEKNTIEKWPEHAGVQVLAGTGGREWAKFRKKKWDAEDVKACADEMWTMNDYACDYRLLVRQLEEFQNCLDLLHSIGLKLMPVDLSESFDEPGQKYSSLTFTPVNTDLQDFTIMDPWVNKYLGCEMTIERTLTNNGSAQVFYNAPVTNLIQDSSGRVVGAKARIDGEVKYVKAKATVIATGGYGANLDMCKYYGWITDFCGCHVGATSNEGDGIRMGQGVGAGLSCVPGCGVADGGVDMLELGKPWTYRETEFYKDQTVSGYTTAVIQLARQPVLKVNGAGKRYMDENGTWKKKTLASFVQPQHHYFTIYDANVEKCVNFIKGSRYGMCENMITPDFRIFIEDEDIRPLWSWKDSLEKGKKLGTIFTANSIESLADKIGVNKKNLMETVKNYNRYCKTGVDEEFGKHKSFLFPVKDAPFMAIKSRASMLWVTQGGLRINDKWRVLTADGSREIPGLYAGSSDAGGMMKPYNFGMENYFQQAAAAVINGKIAGENAALEALGKA